MASEQPISPNLVPPVEPGFATAAESLRVGLPAPTLDPANLVIVPNTHDQPAVELDESLYQLKDAETVFFKQQTGIQDDGALKAHLLSIQVEAYKVHPYPCIRRFSWAKLKISRLFPYQDLLKLGREREGAIFLDIGCCFGNDARKAIADGYPLQNVVTSDLHQAFWDLGHKLFRTTPDTFPVAFVPGDAFDPGHLDVVAPFTMKSPPLEKSPDLRGLTSLNPLRGHVTAIHASAFFHLFPEDGQLHLARALAGLLSPQPDSMVFGQHIGLPETGVRKRSTNRRGMFCHSPESWTKLWDGQVFADGTVKVRAYVTEVPRDEVSRIFPDMDAHVPLYVLTWSVTRL